MFVRVQGHCLKDTHMRWDVQDYRKPDPEPTWLEWTPVSTVAYVVQWFMYVWLVPFALGLVLTPISILITTVLLDWFQYRRAVRSGLY
jgi:hypothetical protein